MYEANLIRAKFTCEIRKKESQLIGKISAINGSLKLLTGKTNKDARVTLEARKQLLRGEQQDLNSFVDYIERYDYL